MAIKRVKINRAPILTLWAPVVAERLGHDLETALGGDGVLSMTLKVHRTKRTPRHEPIMVTVLGRSIPTIRTTQGVRATAKGKPIDPQSVQRYLAQRFGEDLRQAQAAMELLAKAYPPKRLASQAYALYEAFRPSVPEGEKGWGAKGELDLDQMRSLGKSGG